jgi:hypothetical protein
MAKKFRPPIPFQQNGVLCLQSDFMFCVYIFFAFFGCLEFLDILFTEICLSAMIFAKTSAAFILCNLLLRLLFNFFLSLVQCFW